MAREFEGNNLFLVWDYMFSGIDEEQRYTAS